MVSRENEAQTQLDWKSNQKLPELWIPALTAESDVSCNVVMNLGEVN